MSAPRVAGEPSAERAPEGARRDGAAAGTRPARSARVISLAAARERRAILGAARELLAVAEYGDVDFAAVAQAAHVSPADVRRHFRTRTELTLAALQLPAVVRGTDLSRLGGTRIVRLFLSFCESGDNAAIILNVLRAATRDQRVVRHIDDYLTAAVLRPLAGGLGTPDACPRLRLLASALLGLSVSRYVLREEPLASADHETVASWMGPSLDCYLRGALGTV